MGRHHTNPPNPAPNPPKANTATTRRAKGPPAPDTEQGPAREGQATRHPPPGPQARAKTRQQGGARKSRNHYTNHDQPTPHPTHHTTAAGQDTPPHGGPTRGGGRHNLVVVTAPGKRPATFRTWKLSPAAPMVLHPRGCGRVGNRHNTPEGGRAHKRGPPHTPTRAPNQHARATTQQRGHTPTRPRGHTHARHQRGPNTDHANTRARTGAHEPHPRATTRTRASYCARPPSGLRLFMFQQSSGR